MIIILKLKLKQIRKRRRQTQTEFAKAIGISQNFLSEIESGKSFPSSKTLEQISDKLGIPIAKLFANDTNSQSSKSRSKVNKVLKASSV